MDKNIYITNNQMRDRISQLIKEGERLLSIHCSSISQEVLEWFEKVNILNERYLKSHPSHSAIHTVYFHSRNRDKSLEEMLSKLRAVIHDDDFFQEEIKQDSKNYEYKPMKKLIDNGSSPKVFISYSWDSEEHKSWVKGLADLLIAERIKVIIDQYDVFPGKRLPHYMEESITKCDYVLIVCTPLYKAKADDRLAGVGYESDIITGELSQKHNEVKYIPILRTGDFETAIPNYLLGVFAIDLRKENKSYEDSIQDLLTTLRGKTKRPEISKIKTDILIENSEEDKNEVETIHITGIITDEVTLPRNDGTRGSALYSIPFRLSGVPSQQWCDYFIHSWNNPSSFSTMHRPGIASVQGDKIVLNGTTIEEVQDYHRKTLVLAVKRANELMDQYNQKNIQEREKQRKLEEEHNKKVTDIASRIDFNE